MSIKPIRNFWRFQQESPTSRKKMVPQQHTIYSMVMWIIYLYIDHKPCRTRDWTNTVRCPYCQFTESRVLDSRPTDEGTMIRRRRECMDCGERFTTYEKVELTPLWVIKKDGRREMFARQKVLSGLLTACEKRSVPLETLEGLVVDIERTLRNQFEREVESRRIGEMVMERLMAIDEVAYVRFASVYRQFRDLETFRSELERLLTGDQSETPGQRSFDRREPEG